VGKKRVNKYPKAFRLMALERMKNCKSVCALAEELGIHRTVLYHWRNHLKAVESGTAGCPVLASFARAGVFMSDEIRQG